MFSGPRVVQPSVFCVVLYPPLFVWFCPFADCIVLTVLLPRFKTSGYLYSIYPLFLPVFLTFIIEEGAKGIPLDKRL